MLHANVDNPAGSPLPNRTYRQVRFIKIDPSFKGGFNEIRDAKHFKKDVFTVTTLVGSAVEL